MADYHVLRGQEDGRAYEVVYHVPVRGTNAIGTSIASCLREDTAINYAGGSSGKRSRVPFVSPLEQAALNDGRLFEVSETIGRNPALTGAQQRALIDRRFREHRNGLGSVNLRNVYHFWRFERDVP